jgi:hypothetical protein
MFDKKFFLMKKYKERKSMGKEKRGRKTGEVE